MSAIIYYEWQRVERLPDGGLDVLDECGDQHVSLAAAQLCANMCAVDFQPNVIAKVAVGEQGDLDLLALRGFRPRQPRNLFEALAWGRPI